ncbi:MAG: MFS transporter, partial [Dongiaceae bacterium]
MMREEPSARLIIPALGITQILAWGSSYYLPAVLAGPIARDTGWSLSWVAGGLSLGLLIAGLVSPKVGRYIHHAGGRPVLAASAGLLALGHISLALSPNLPCFFLAWAILGLGMGAGLYDPAFATLGRLYGSRARHHIATLTLFGGFASTICWPLSAFLVTHLGWRGTCLSYAAIHLALCLPLYLLALPKDRGDANALQHQSTEAVVPLVSRSIFLLLALTITISAVVSTVISVHLLTILQDRGIVLAAAVALGAIVGPCQVGARFIEMLVAKYHHPIWVKVVSVASVATGLILLWIDIPMVFLALIFYGAGIGLESIARATVPLALFGPQDYAPIMGKLARPSLIAQAAAPSVGALLIQFFGASEALGVFVCIALINVVLVLALFTLA